MAMTESGEWRGTDSAKPAEGELIIRRLFDAPRELVYRAWTDPAHFSRWFGPEGCATPYCTMDARPGGLMHFCMRLPDGRDYWHKGVFREVVEPARLVIELFFVDAEGNPTSHPAFPEHWPVDSRFITALDFAEHGGGTLLTVRQSVVRPPATGDTFVVERGMARAGWADSLDRLGAVVTETDAGAGASTAGTPARPAGWNPMLSLFRTSDRELIITREFDAPRELVFAALTEPEHLAHWWGPRVLELTVCDVDLRPGGAYRFVQRAPDGTEHPFRGVYREVVAPERLVFTQIYEPYGDTALLVTMTLEEHHGRTVLITRNRFDEPGTMSAYIESGMEWGLRQSYERLDEWLAMQAARPA